MTNAPSKQPPSRRGGFNGLLVAVGIAVLLVVGLLVGRFYFGPDAESAAPAALFDTDPKSIGGPFTLVDQDGRTVTDETYRGTWQLIYFGFTFCPDVCPTALNRNVQALGLLDAQARKKITPMLISVDPERDTPEALKPYVAAFSPDMVGLTGTSEQIEAVAREFRVYYAKAPYSETDYLVDHSSLTYLMDPKGRFVQFFSHETTPEEMAEVLRKQL